MQEPSFDLENELKAELDSLPPPPSSLDDQANNFLTPLDEQWRIIRRGQGSVDKHHRIITTIQGRRNSTVPKISTLPPEILGRVFLQLQSIPRYTIEDPYHGPKNTYEWLKAGRVCRYWRDVIFSCPKLFSYLEVSDLDEYRLREFIRLSAAVPLTIYVSRPYSSMNNLEPYWRIIIPHLARAKFLYTDGAPHFTNDWPHCPLMKVFHWGRPYRDLFIPKGDAKSILSCMPNLEIFHGQAIAMHQGWLETSLVRNLRELHIFHTQVPSRPSRSISINRLGVVLASLPSLTHICFYGLGEHEYPSSNTSPAAYPLLLRLEELILHGTIKGVENILQLPFSATRVEVYMSHPPHPRGISTQILIPSLSLGRLWLGSDPAMRINILHISHSYIPPNKSLNILVSGDTTSVQLQLDIHCTMYYSTLRETFKEWIKAFLPSTLDIRQLGITEHVPNKDLWGYRSWYFNLSYLSDLTQVFIRVS